MRVIWIVTLIRCDAESFPLLNSKKKKTKNQKLPQIVEMRLPYVFFDGWWNIARNVLECREIVAIANESHSPNVYFKIKPNQTKPITIISWMARKLSEPLRQFRCDILFSNYNEIANESKFNGRDSILNDKTVQANL